LDRLDDGTRSRDRRAPADRYRPGERPSDGKFPVITDPREVYSGRWARAKLDSFAYDRKDGKGVSFGLINVQLLKHDTKFGGAVSDPNKDFDEVSEEWARHRRRLRKAAKRRPAKRLGLVVRTGRGLAPPLLSIPLKLETENMNDKAENPRAVAGDNSTSFARDRLKSYVERVERSKKRRRLADDIRDVYAEAKGQRLRRQGAPQACQAPQNGHGQAQGRGGHSGHLLPRARN
jgi:hypothetical protein